MSDADLTMLYFSIWFTGAVAGAIVFLQDKYEHSDEHWLCMILNILWRFWAILGWVIVLFAPPVVRYIEGG